MKDIFNHPQHCKILIRIWRMFTLRVWTFCIYWRVWEWMPENANIIKAKVRTFCYTIT